MKHKQQHVDQALRELARPAAVIALAYGLGFLTVQLFVGLLLGFAGPTLGFSMKAFVWLLLLITPYAFALALLVFFMRRRRPLQSPGMTAVYAIAFVVLACLLSVVTWAVVTGTDPGYWPFVVAAAIAYAAPVAVAISVTAITIAVFEWLFPVTDKTIRNRMRNRGAGEDWSDGEDRSHHAPRDERDQLTSKSRFPLWLALVLSGISGAFGAVQTRLNGGLGQAIDNGYIAAAFSFSTGLIVLVAIMVFSPKMRKGLRLVKTEIRSRRLPWWSLTGGLSGACFVMGQGVVAPIIGVALFTVSIVAGQVIGGLLLDRIGVGPGGRVDPTLMRVIGSVLAIAAVTLTVVADLIGGTSITVYVWLVIAPMFMGAAIGWQAAVNGLLRAAANSVMSATLISFAVGTLMLLLIAGVSVGANGWPSSWPHNPLLYIGGPLGIMFVAVTAMLVRTAGVLLIGMSNVAGQLVSSLLLEGSVPLADGITVWMVLGTTLALVAVTVATLPSGSARQSLQPRPPRRPQT